MIDNLIAQLTILQKEENAVSETINEVI